MSDIRLEYIVTAIKALALAERVLTQDEFLTRSRATTECLIARAQLEAAIGQLSVSILPEVQS